MFDFKNEVNWESGDCETLPLTLHEKGLGITGFRKFMFYFSVTVAMLSMCWAFVISWRILQLYLKDSVNIPKLYIPMALIGICVSVFCIKSFFTLVSDKRKYVKDVVIDRHYVNYYEITGKGTESWKEKVKKFQEVKLTHYNYRGSILWYIAIRLQDKTVLLYYPDYASSKAPEEDKKELLGKYANLLGLIPVYEPYKNPDSNPEEQKAA